jgi:hypothetical protein
MFPYSGERRKTATLLGPLERANFNHVVYSNVIAVYIGII